MPRIMRTVQRIDVIWLKDDFPVYAFEVEHTTDITKGLLRLHQLTQFQTRLFIISSKEMQRKFDVEISKTRFIKFKTGILSGHIQSCNYFISWQRDITLKRIVSWG